MSWSVRGIGHVDEARVAIEQGIKWSRTGGNSGCPESIEGVINKYLEAAPEGAVVIVSSNGHFNSDGTGTATLSVEIVKQAVRDV